MSLRGSIGRLAGILLAVMLVSAVSGCGGGAKEIKVGCFYPMTGSNAMKGQLNKNGTLLAIDDINAAGGLLGRKVVAVVEDTQSKKENVPNVVRKLIEQDKVVVLMGEVASSNSIAAGPVVKQLKVPAIAPTSTNPKVVLDPEDLTKLNPYYFRACFIDPLQGSVLANFVSNNLKKTRAALLYNIAQDYNKGLAEYFKNRFQKNGGTIVAEETYPDQTQDFKPQLTKIKQANPEVVITPNTYAESGLILRQAKELGLNAIFLAGDATHAPKVIEIAGDAAEGLYLTTLYAPDDPDPKAQAFAKKYRDKYKEEPNSNSCFSYEAMMVIAEAIKKAGKAEPEAIRDAMENQIKDLDVPSGKFTMDPKTHNPLNKPVVVIQVKQGNFVFVTKVAPE
ncbi:MAG: ABC transporter substrate-binding protein [Firmicutes bacterium]|jgi:branched-chain amino acid transport system substrate-binding protein|nr:ABC transporter substrate-binding protein [Bacillota bacterium]